MILVFQFEVQTPRYRDCQWHSLAGSLAFRLAVAAAALSVSSLSPARPAARRGAHGTVTSNLLGRAARPVDYKLTRNLSGGVSNLC